MFKKIEKYGCFIIAICILSLTSPVISNAAGNKDLGKDWYCSDPEEHTADYQKHVKHHIDQGAEFIAGELEKIFANQSLTANDKHEKTVEVLNRYLLKVKSGIGD